MHTAKSHLMSKTLGALATAMTVLTSQSDALGLGTTSTTTTNGRKHISPH